jgi:uncharacterized protein (TIGR02145 family)
MRNLALVWVLAACLLGCGGKPSYTKFTDTRDGNVYKIVKIGSQKWFAENLNYAAEGSKCNGEGGKVTYSGKYGDIQTTLSIAEVQANCTKYGRLYNWETAKQACPAGWHLPSDDEWYKLEKSVRDVPIAGTKLKSSEGWNHNGNGTDDYGFSAFPGGKRYSDGIFDGAGNFGHWWSATELDAIFASYCIMFCYHEFVHWYYNGKTGLFSVRCVRD